MTGVNINQDSTGRILVSFQYDPVRVKKIKTIPSHKWHPKEKYWSFPNSDGTLEKILKVLSDSSDSLRRKDEEIHIDPALQAQLPHPVVASTTPPHPSLRGTKSRGNLIHSFEDLKRELLSRKYSYKTMKGYLYYKRDFLSFIKKQPVVLLRSSLWLRYCHSRLPGILLEERCRTSRHDRTNTSRSSYL